MELIIDMTPCQIKRAGSFSVWLADGEELECRSETFAGAVRHCAAILGAGRIEELEIRGRFRAGSLPVATAIG